VVGGLIALVVVLAAASAVGFAVRKRQGRFRPVGPSPAGTPFAGGTQSSPEGTQSSDGTGAADTVPPSSPGSGLSAADLGAPLGARATLVQFSTEVCAYCGPTRELLTEVARERDGVAFVEIDAAARMDLTKRLHVMSTPTVLVLDAVGGITSRASGPVRKADLVTAVGQVLRPTGGTS
jgi:Thioredoxin